MRYSRAVARAECGRRSKTHWTQLVSFKAHSLDGTSFLLEKTGSGQVHPPLTPVWFLGLRQTAPRLARLVRALSFFDPISRPD
jgi:hypothetical protein